MTIRRPAAVLLIVLGLAACRGGDPDEAPPIGRVQTDPADTLPDAAMPPPAVALRDAPDAVGAPDTRDTIETQDHPQRYRDAAMSARRDLDAAWNRCGAFPGPRATRCRDEAVVTYDTAMNHARATYGDHVDAAPASVPGTLDNPDAIAAIQVTGTRG